jgi:hypothetical protein
MLISGLKGQFWIEPVEKVIVKIQGELTGPFGVGFFSSLRPGSAPTLETMPIGNGLWAPKRIEFASIQKYPGVFLLPKTAHSRNVDEMSDYRQFDPEAKDLFTKQ